MGKVLKPHHRRPRSMGGSDSPYNISWVPRDLHNSWHTLFGNMNAYQIANRINSLDVPYKPDNVYVFCKFINGEEVGGSSVNCNFSKDEAKIMLSWLKVFGEMKFEEVISYINNTWLDPSYHLYVRKIGC